MPMRTRPRGRLGPWVLSIAVTAWGLAPVSVAAALAQESVRGAHASPPTEWVGAGKFRKVYDTTTQTPPRYINDHTVIRAPDGTWHMFGITGVKAPPGQAPDSEQEDSLAHATAPALQGPWTTQLPALTVDPNYHGERHLWAPHVIAVEGTYYMFYAAGSGSTAAINLATSTDLYTWTRHPSGPLFRDGFEARDPWVARVGNQWVMYYCATSTATGGNHVVAYRTSSDLVHWGPRQIAYTDPSGAHNSLSVTESPVVVAHGGWWYLFIGPRGGYVGTDVYRSTTPFSFQVADYAGHVPAHAPEIVQDGSRWWATGAGWFQEGLYLAPLHWRTTPPVWQSIQNPAVARDADGRLEAFALAPDHSAILNRRQTAPNGGWSGWEPFGGPAAAAPVVGQNADGRLEVFALAPDGASIMNRRQIGTGGGWSDWTQFGGPAGAAPAVARNADGRLEVFALGPGGAYIAHRRQTAPNGGWSEWAQFGGPAGSPPVVGQNADGRLEVFALSPGRAAIFHRWQTPNGGWSDWAQFGGPAGAAPVVAQNSDGRLEVFALAPMGVAINHRWQTAPNGSWSDWAHFGSWAGATPAVGRNADGRLEVFAIGPGNDYISHRSQTAPSNGWGSWAIFGGPAACIPSVGQSADGRLEVFALTPGGASIAHRWQTAPSNGWSSWTTFGAAAGGIPCGSAT